MPQINQNVFRDIVYIYAESSKQQIFNGYLIQWLFDHVWLSKRILSHK